MREFMAANVLYRVEKVKNVDFSDVFPLSHTGYFGHLSNLVILAILAILTIFELLAASHQEIKVNFSHFYTFFFIIFTLHITCSASNLHWMIISLRRLHDLDLATPDELEGLRGKARKEKSEKMQIPGALGLRVGSQAEGSSSRGSQSSQNSKTVLKIMITIQQATDLNVIGGKLIESAEKEKLSIQHAFALENNVKKTVDKTNKIWPNF